MPHRFMAGFVVWSVALAVVAVRPAAAAEPVRVTILEGLPPGWSWRSPGGVSLDSYTAPALGLVRIPAKYNTRGIEIDRKSPFALHAQTAVVEAPGSYRLILRARGRAWLVIDGVALAETNPITPNASGHEEVPVIPPPADARWHAPAPGEQERIVPWTSDGRAHRVDLWATIGEKGTRLETGELSVSVVADGGVPSLLGGGKSIELTDEAWWQYAELERVRIQSFNTLRRRQAAASDDPYWRARHAYAREHAARTRPPIARDRGNPIDAWIRRRLDDAKVSPRPPVADAAFFRRLALDTIGVIPAPEEVEAFLADARPDKRARAIDDRLADPRWADGWMGYWQDVLAENPGLIKPTLNNSGPFRSFLHNAFEDNVPFDRFATELIRMEGSVMGGGPAGFGVATQNDAPMAAKAHILAKALLAADMACARCHDAPSHPFEQADLFALAGFLEGKPATIPATSTVPRQPGGRVPAVSVSLKAGDRVEPKWKLAEIAPEAFPALLYPPKPTSRDRLAILFTSPHNTRFAPVIVNRLWKRYVGAGLVEPVDDWDGERTKPSHPELLADLARELVTHDYDLKHVARLILNSAVYQAQVDPGRSAPASSSEARLFAGPIRRRMPAEALLDSLFAAAGKSFRAEDLDVEPQGRRPAHEMLNLGNPRKAWQLASTSNERDRPSLALPVVQTLVDLLQTFGWRPNRQDPVTERDEATTALQPAILANGLVAQRVSRLSDDGAIAELCLTDQPAGDLIRSVYFQILSRPPSPSEVQRVTAYLGDRYAGRIVPGAKAVALRPRGKRRVSWSNHLSPEASRIQLEEERSARAGDPPTPRLTGEFRERMEDVVWALFNSPEFLFIP